MSSGRIIVLLVTIPHIGTHGDIMDANDRESGPVKNIEDRNRTSQGREKYIG
jgi:hypothetical protein